MEKYLGESGGVRREGEIVCGDEHANASGEKMHEMMKPRVDQIDANESAEMNMTGEEGGEMEMTAR